MSQPFFLIKINEMQSLLTGSLSLLLTVITVIPHNSNCIFVLSFCSRLAWDESTAAVLGMRGGRYLDHQELPSPFLVLSTTRLTMTGIRQMGVITRAKMMAGGGSLSSSVGQSLKNLEWMSTKICSTRGLGHGIRRQSEISSVQKLMLLYKLDKNRMC